MRHRKMTHLSRLLGSPAVARGSLELVWEVAYENGDDNLGSAADVEQAACWRGRPGRLVAALVKAGFLDRDGRTYRVHDLYDHAPEYVRKRMDREEARRAAGRTLSQVRAEAAGKRWARSKHADASGESVAAACNANGTPPAPAPTPAPSPTPAGLAAGAAVENFQAGVEKLLGASLPAEGPEVALAIAAEVDRLGLPAALAVARTAIEKMAKQGKDRPETLRFFLGWLKKEPTPQRPNGDASADLLAAAIEAHQGTCPEWADLLRRFPQSTPADRDAAAKWLAPIRAHVADGVLHLEAPTPYAANFVRDTYATDLEAEAGLKVEVSP